MNRNNYWKIFKEEICSNKIILLSAIIIAIVSFGFAITNFSVGVDDPMRDHYLYSGDSGSMIQQGRLLHVVFNGVTGLVDYIPFFNEFVAAGLFLVSALLFAALFQYITNNKFSVQTVTAFCCIYVSYSIINEKFIYSLDIIVTMISYCCSALALMYAYKFTEENSRSAFLKSLLLLIVAMGSYESFIFVYFCGVFIIFVLQICTNNVKMTLKTFLQKGIKYASILLVALVIYYGIVYVIQIATNQYGIFERNNAWQNSNGVFWNFKEITKTILKDLLVWEYLPILEFVVFSGLGSIFCIYSAIRKRSLVLLISFASLVVGNLVIHYFCGYIMYRAAQTFCLFVAFIALMLIEELRGVNILKKPLIVLTVFIVMLQAADLNRWFYNDYIRYRKESFVVDTIATRLVAECDISKPVVFVNNPYDGYLNNNIGTQNSVNGNSMIYWGIGAFLKGTMHEIFESYGYDFLIKATDAQVEAAKEISIDMTCWPNEGCIKEVDSFIVVNMGSR